MDFLRELRERRRFTQAELAERCRCHSTTISQMEARRMLPSLVLFARMTRVLRISPTKLLRWFVPEEFEEPTRVPPSEVQERRESRAGL